MERQENPVFEGVVEDGVIRLREVAKLPDGTRVTVRVASSKRLKKAGTGRTTKRSRGKKKPGLEILLKYAGILRAAPDASANHDHYLYGAPKRKK